MMSKFLKEISSMRLPESTLIEPVSRFNQRRYFDFLINAHQPTARPHTP
jgi:hypothetical protein